MSVPAGTILFLLRNLYYLRNFEAPIRLLAQRGHRLVILSDPAKQLPQEIRRQADALKADHPDTIIFAEAHGRKDFRRRLADEIHTGRDILRYYTPQFRPAAKLRRRAATKATPLARIAYDRNAYWNSERNLRADRRLERWDAALPADRSIVARIGEIAPGLLVVTPLVDLRTDQIDWVRAARALQIPTVLAVASWDNLTSKSRIQAPIDCVLVWNEIQRKEAIDLHGIAAETILVTGAQLYDEWFERSPTQDRRAFCEVHRFDPDRRIILYVGSSASITKDEPHFIRRWLTAIRASADPELAAANVLIRPHPMNFVRYDALDLADLGPVAVAPLHGGLPVTEEARATYFDTLFHCDLVVGLNTSALVEASILGKSCFTIGDPDHQGGQQETLHYHYLTAARVLHETPDLDLHTADLAATLRGGVRGNGAAADFVNEFIRPHGPKVAATPIFVDAIEASIGRQVAAPKPEVAPLGRFMLDVAALASLALFGGWHAFRRIGRAKKREMGADLEPR